MICIARTFGAPETVPAGKHARRSSNGPTPSRSSPTTSETRWVTWEKRSASMNRSTAPSRPGTRGRGRSGRDRRASRAPPGPSRRRAAARRRPRPAVVVPAIGFSDARRPVALDERLGRGADERDSAELEQEEVRRGVHAPKRAVERERRRARRALGPLREDDLERVAGTDVLLARGGRSPRARPARGSGGAARAEPSPGATSGNGPSSARPPCRGRRRAPRPCPVTGRNGRASPRRRSASSGNVGPLVRERHRRLEPGRPVVADVADDRLASASASLRKTSREPAPTNE